MRLLQELSGSTGKSTKKGDRAVRTEDVACGEVVRSVEQGDEDLTQDQNADEEVEGEGKKDMKCLATGGGDHARSGGIEQKNEDGSHDQRRSQAVGLLRHGLSMNGEVTGFKANRERLLLGFVGNRDPYGEQHKLPCVSTSAQLRHLRG